MRQLKLIAAFVLLGVAVLSGCTTSGGGASPSYSMTATIASVHMSGSVCIAGLVSNTMGIAGSTVTSGVGGPPQINITIANWTNATGTFTIGTASAGGTYAEYTPATGSLTSTSQSGSVTISSVSSTTITGTFNFTCSDGTVVTAGTFTAKRS